MTVPKKPKIILDYDHVTYKPQYPINPILNTPVYDEICVPELGVDDPCLYFDNELVDIYETATSKGAGETQVGLASFYSTRLDGACTSVQGYFNPETQQLQKGCKPFDGYDYYVASRKYAPGTVLDITDLSTWQSMYVVVGDWGPNERFGKETKALDRIVDLPRSVYYRLHGDLGGTFPVMTRVVSNPVFTDVSMEQKEFVPCWEEEGSSLPAIKRLYDAAGLSTKEGILPRITIGTTNKIDALTILFDLAQKYPGHVYYENTAAIFKKGSVAWIDGKWKTIKSDLKLKYYKVGVVPLTSLDAGVMKQASDYIATKKHWPSKQITVKIEK